MAYDPTNLLHSLATYIVGRAAAGAGGLPAATIAYLTRPRQLWREAAVEGQGSDGVANCADPYTVMKIYGGPALQWHPLVRMNVQMQTVATDAAGDEAGGLAQSWLLYQTLIEDDQKPVRMKTINGYLASGTGTTADGTYLIHHLDPLQRPGMTGRDDQGRGLWTWNFEIGVVKTS